MALIGMLGFFLSMFIIIQGSLRGYSIIILSVIATFVVAVTNRMNVMGAFFTGESSYIFGVASFFVDYFIIFLLSSILAQYIENSGAAKSIADYILEKTGKDRPYIVLISIFLISAVLTLGGVNLFVALFVIIPLARNIFKELNLSWKLIVTPYFLGSSFFTMTVIPGSPSIQNVIMSNALGTTLTTVPLYSLVLAAFMIGWALWRMRVELNRSIKNDEIFEDRFDKEDEIDYGNLPPFGVSIAPLATLFLAIIAGSFLSIDSITIYALVISVILATLLFHRYLDGHQNSLNNGAANSITSVMSPAVAVGFGTVITTAPAFENIMTFIQSLPLTPIMSLVLLTAILQLVMGSASGVLGIISERFIPLYDLSSYNPGFVHRMVLMTPAFMPPQVGVLLTFYNVTGLKHEESYRDVMVSLNLGVALSLVLGYFLGLLFF